MKKFTLLLLIACLTAGATASAQRITYHKRNASLKDLLSVIAEQTGYGHIFNGKTLERVKRVDISVDNAPLREALDEFFKDQPLTYTIIGEVISIQPRTPLPEVILVTGRITDEKNEPVPAATITIAGTTRAVAGNDDGEFMFPEVGKTATLVITSVNYQPREIKLEGESTLHIQLKPKSTELVEVSVVATGYQTLVKEGSPGSYTKINNELLNRRVSTNILDRLDDVTPGMILNKNVSAGTNQSSRTIRGRSTIFSNSEPLIVLDNFPYPGDPGNINPNDIESITVLKDANAAAIWGAFSGNGVIVMTTKKGRYKQTPRLTLNNNVTIGGKLDAWYPPALGVGDYISLEKDLFGRGYYDAAIADPAHQALSPVVEELDKAKNGLITPGQLDARLGFYLDQDTRKEIDKYFYRNSVNQQYSISTSGGGTNNTYYLSAGFDKNQQNLVGNKSQRITLTVNNTYSWFKNRLELSTGIAFADTKGSINNFNTPGVFYPYLQFVNNAGDFVPIPYQYRLSYIESLEGNALYDGLLDWNYNPVKEIRDADNNTRLTDYRINGGLKYKIAKGLTANFLYQFNKGNFDRDNIRNTATYFTRDMINRFSQFEGSAIVYKVPNKAIADKNHENYRAQNLRAQLNFGHSWTGHRDRSHQIAVLAGIEVRDISTEYSFKRIYGYDGTTPMGVEIDDSTYFPMLHAPFAFEQIPNPSLYRKTSDRYISYYITAAYTLQQRYTFSLTGRKDESNLFGVETNKKGVPLFSVGAGWEISQENFYTWKWLPYLKFRATHGYNGNVNKSVSALISASMGSNPQNIYGEPYSSIINPPNPYLRWEKVQITNIGIDFTVAKQIVDGSIEYYVKRGTDLIGNSPLDPSTGFPQFMNNSAAMSGNGVDIMIATNNINRRLRWNTVVIFNRNVDKVTSYKVQQNSIAGYYNPDLLNPLEDRPLYSIYSLKWMGLDPANGDPQGLLKGQISKNYDSLRSSKDFNDLVYNGPANPTFFGSLRNNISWKQFSLSFNITWKAGHYFRRSSIEYNDLLLGRSKGHPDYNRRWEKPGDEKNTYIPSIDYSGDRNRDAFFKFSEVLVEKGDLIRFQDLRLSYDLNRQNLKKLSMQSMSFYIYVNNLGLLWKATEYDVDPDYVSGYPNPMTWSAGIKVEF